MRYNNPNKFSFKDVIAVVFIGFFLYTGKRSLTPDEIMAARALSVFTGLTPSVVVILTGYFGQEIYTQYTKYKSNDGNMLGG